MGTIRKHKGLIDKENLLDLAGVTNKKQKCVLPGKVEWAMMVHTLIPTLSRQRLEGDWEF